MKRSRRWVLKGLGAALAIPVLPSLLPRRAEAQAVANAPRYFVNLGTSHGGFWEEFLYPTTATQPLPYAGRTVARGPLALTTAAGVSSLSNILSGSSGTFTASLAAKMNVLRGLDVPFHLGHNTGGALGNFARNDGNGPDGKKAQAEAARPTIDQVIGASSHFYPDPTVLRDRVLVLSSRASYNFENPTAQTGAIQELAPVATTSAALFDRLFPSAVGSARRPVIDKVIESYRALKNTPRLSSADKDRLEDHVQRVDELQRRLLAPTHCAAPPRPPAAYERRPGAASTTAPPRTTQRCRATCTER